MFMSWCPTGPKSTYLLFPRPHNGTGCYVNESVPELIYALLKITGVHIFWQSSWKIQQDSIQRSEGTSRIILHINKYYDDDYSYYTKNHYYCSCDFLSWGTLNWVASVQWTAVVNGFSAPRTVASVVATDPSVPSAFRRRGGVWWSLMHPLHRIRVFFSSWSEIFRPFNRCWNSCLLFEVVFQIIDL